jgi:hypothetical protein
VLRTAWFLFLALTALLVLVAVRTPRWSWQGPRPSAITFAVATAAGATFLIVDVPALRQLFGFTAIAPLAQAGIIGLVALYIAAIDLLKWFLRTSSSTVSRRAARPFVDAVAGNRDVMPPALQQPD